MPPTIRSKLYLQRAKARGRQIDNDLWKDMIESAVLKNSAGGIDMSSLGLGDPSELTFLRGDGTWATAGFAFEDEPANVIFAGPAAGSDAEPDFRALVAADLGSGSPAGKFLRGDLTWQSIDLSAYLTSAAAASTYLPLTGGTLTGALTLASINPGFGALAIGGYVTVPGITAGGAISMSGSVANKLTIRGDIGMVAWSNDSSSGGTLVLGLSRQSDTMLELNNGISVATTGAYRDLRTRGLYLAGSGGNGIVFDAGTGISLTYGVATAFHCNNGVALSGNGSGVMTAADAQVLVRNALWITSTLQLKFGDLSALTATVGLGYASAGVLKVTDASSGYGSLKIGNVLTLEGGGGTTLTDVDGNGACSINRSSASFTMQFYNQDVGIPYGGKYQWTNGAVPNAAWVRSAAGNVYMYDPSGGNTTPMIGLGGAAITDVAWKKNGTTLEARLGNDSNPCGIRFGTTTAGYLAQWIASDFYCVGGQYGGHLRLQADPTYGFLDIGVGDGLEGAIASKQGLDLYSGVSIRLFGTVADGATNVAAVVDTTVAWANAGAKLLSIKNNAVEKAYFTGTGCLRLPAGGTGVEALQIGAVNDGFYSAGAGNWIAEVAGAPVFQFYSAGGGGCVAYGYLGFGGVAVGNAVLQYSGTTLKVLAGVGGADAPFTCAALTASGVITAPLGSAAGPLAFTYAGNPTYGFYFDSFYGPISTGTGGLTMAFGANVAYPLLLGGTGIIMWATAALAAGGAGFAFGAGLAYNALGVVEVNDGQTRGVLRDLTLRNVVGQTGYTEMIEMTAPAAPAANQVRIYAVDNGGKTELIALFNSGAAQRLAIEP